MLDLVFSCLLLLGLQHCYGNSNFIGTPPRFVVHPADTVVKETVLYEFEGRKVNLILHSFVTGDPTPIVTWFKGNRDITREGIVNSTGSIGLNVTERDVGRAGVLYHCRATNHLGPNNSLATIRSRDANVSYAYFGGFRDSYRKQTVRTRLGQSVALECAVLESNPKPAIQWVENYLGLRESPVELSNSNLFIESVQGGRYLYFSRVTAQIIRNNPYSCLVTNVFGSSEPRLGIIFNITSNLPDNQYKVFMPLEPTLVAFVGKNVIVRISTAYGTNYAPHYSRIRCFTGGSEISGISGRYVYRVPDPPFGNFIRCIGTAGGRVRLNASVNLTFVKPPAIEALSTDPNEFKREAYTGDPPIILSCANTGIPSPQVRWFHNGNPFSGSKILTILGSQLTISTESSSFGVYQCFVSNGVPAPLEDVQRTWVIIVSPLIPPSISSLVKTNRFVVKDILENYLLVRPLNSRRVTITVEVRSNPCPLVQWIFKGENISRPQGENISRPHPLYIYNDPCLSLISNYTYQSNLTINLLNSEASGKYSVLVNNLRLRRHEIVPFYVTIPVRPQPIRITMEIMNKSSLNCFLDGSTVILTCDLIGYPRPGVEFYHNNSQLVPAIQSRISIVRFDQISINGIRFGDQGEYHCRTLATSRETTIIQVSMFTNFSYCKLPVAVIASNPNVKEHNRLDIVCEVDGSPIPTITWFKNSARIHSQGEKIKIETTGRSSIVSITSATSESDGNYSCMATSLIGSVNKTLAIKVKRYPHVVTFSGNINLRKGDRLDITCQVDGYPMPTIIWLKDDVMIHSEGSSITITSSEQLSVLSIQSVSSVNNGFYTCLGRNNIGSDQRTLPVLIVNRVTYMMPMKYAIGTSTVVAIVVFYSIL